MRILNIYHNLFNTKFLLDINAKLDCMKKEKIELPGFDHLKFSPLTCENDLNELSKKLFDAKYYDNMVILSICIFNFIYKIMFYRSFIVASI